MSVAVHFGKQGDQIMLRRKLTVLLAAALVAAPAWAAEDEVTATDSDIYSDQAGEVAEESEELGEEAEDMGDQAGEVGDQAGELGEDVASDEELVNDEFGFEEDAGEAGTASGTTTQSESEVSQGLIQNEVFSVKPQLGAMVFDDGTGTTTRGTGGFMLDWNLAETILPDNMSGWYVGPSAGLLYSHMGAPGSNFIGTDSPTTGVDGNFFAVPVNAKIGYAVTDNFRVGVHGGGNWVYRSAANSVILGDESFASGSTSDIFPNVGADIEFGLGPNTLLSLRPDIILGSQDNIFSGTVGLGIGLG